MPEVLEGVESDPAVRPIHRAGPRRWDRWFLAIGLPFGAILLFFLPPATAIDAPNHLVRIDQIARGQLVAPLNERGKAMVRPDSCLSPRVSSMSQWAFIEPKLARQFHGTPCGQRVEVDISNTALNTPVPYLPAVVGYSLGRLFGGVLLGVWSAKLASLAVYLLLCWIAIRIAPLGKPLLFLVALLPTSMTQAANLSADPVAIALGLLAVALVLRLRLPDPERGSADTSRRMLWGFACCLVLLALSKNLYAVMALLVFLVPANRFQSVRNRRGFTIGVLGAVALSAGAWAILVVNRVRLDFVPFFGTDSVAQKAWILDHPLGFARVGAKTLFGTATITHHTLPGVVASWSVPGNIAMQVAPILVSLTAIAVAAAAVATDVVRHPAVQGTNLGRDRLLRWGIPAVVLVTVTALVLYGEAVTLSPPLATYAHVPIPFIEGRFFTPILPMLVLVPLARRPAVGVASDGATDHPIARRCAWATLLGVVVLTGWYLFTVAGMYR